MTPIVYSDADNTLWETDAVYRRAHLWLFAEIVRRLGVAPEMKDPVAFVRAVDQELAHSHSAHLGYPPSLLVERLLTCLAPVGAPAWPDDLIAKIESEFTKLTGQLPVLRMGVIKGLKRLHGLRYPVHVMTEGSVERCRHRLMHYSILDYVQTIEKVVKDEAHFAALRAKLSSDGTGWVIGDLLTRDIMPARAAGLRTIYFPGSFLPVWEQSVTIPPDVIQVKSFAEVPSIIQKTAAEERFADAAR